MKHRKSLNTAQSVEGDFDMKTLVIYFSQTGTTKAAAERIAEIKKADLTEIRPEKSYEMSYWKTVFTSLKEIFTKVRPELAMEIPDIQQYDRILLGCPKLVRSCAQCSTDAVRFLEFKRKACGFVYYKRCVKTNQACRKIKESLSGGQMA